MVWIFDLVYLNVSIYSVKFREPPNMIAITLCFAYKWCDFTSNKLATSLQVNQYCQNPGFCRFSSLDWAPPYDWPKSALKLRFQHKKLGLV